MDCLGAVLSLVKSQNIFGVNASNKCDVAPVWRENDWASLSDDAQDAVPQEASGFGVHPGGRLILQWTKSFQSVPPRRFF